MMGKFKPSILWKYLQFHEQQRNITSFGDLVAQSHLIDWISVSEHYIFNAKA